MHRCVCVCVCVYIYIYIYIYNIQKHIYIGMHAPYVHVCIQCKYVCYVGVFMYTYDICLYIYVCVCVYLGSSLSFQHVWLNNKDKFCQHNFIKILSSFLISVLLSRKYGIFKKKNKKKTKSISKHCCYFQN